MYRPFSSFSVTTPESQDFVKLGLSGYLANCKGPLARHLRFKVNVERSLSMSHEASTGDKAAARHELIYGFRMF